MGIWGTVFNSFACNCRIILRTFALLKRYTWADRTEGILPQKPVFPLTALTQGNKK